MNLIGRSTGRVSVYGGGGPGYWLFDRRFTQTPATTNAFSSATFCVQALGGVDVAIGSRFIVYGQ